MGVKSFESFKDCPTGQSNAISKQSAEINQKNAEVEKLKAQYGTLYSQALTNSMLIRMNAAKSKAVGKDIPDERDKKMKELNKLDKSFGSAKKPFKPDVLTPFAKALSKGPDAS